MNNIKEKVVEASGFVIECEHPLELSWDGNFASGYFADIIFDYRYNECLSSVMELFMEKWHNNPEQTFADFLKEIDLLEIEYKEWVKFQKLPLRLHEKFSKIFLENPSKFKDYI